MPRYQLKVAGVPAFSLIKVINHARNISFAHKKEIDHGNLDDMSDTRESHPRQIIYLLSQLLAAQEQALRRTKP